MQPFLGFDAGAFDSYDAFQFRENKFLGMAGGDVIGYKWLNEKDYGFEIDGELDAIFFQPTGVPTQKT